MIKPFKTALFLLIVTSFITSFISGCSKKEEKLVDRNTFSKVLAELMIIENLRITESERIYLANNVFEKFNVDTSLFNKTKRHYMQNEEFWIKIYSHTEELIRAVYFFVNKYSIHIQSAREGV